MNIGILGIRGSKLDEREKEKAIEKIVEIVDKFAIPDLELMTMHSPNGGINAMVEMYAESNKIKHRLYNYGTSVFDWKESSAQLAEDCDVLFCLTTKIKNDKCHHCLDYTHESTGGCYAMKQAKDIGKKTKLIIL
jgi:hypothetical protein